MSLQSLTALPVYNEVAHVNPVLDEVVRYSREVLVVDDGSTDGTSDLLAGRNDIHLVAHPRNRGYGAALRTAFDFAITGGYDVLVTIDCDGQHEPQRIPQFVEAAREADIVSGSRYLERFPGDSRPPEDRRGINETITREVNQSLGLNLTDAFCGFKAYRISALERMDIRDTGYAMPLELWVQAARLGLKIIELPVPLIYLDESRSFGGSLDDAQRRLAVYREVLRDSLAAAEATVAAGSDREGAQ
ncbi:MAG: glycosyltransferase family 2 protein [Rhodopirellula sp.]|nr:glycosyltransferase family 2 protein [Rhodopirellula sp.]